MRSVDLADTIDPGGRQVDDAYWQNRALASVKDHGAGSDIADYDYIGGRVLKRTMQNDVNLDFENGSATYYDSLGRPTTWKHVKSGTMKIGFDLTYDRAGNPTAISLQHDTAKGSFSSIGYDSANRLLSSTHSGAWSGQPLAEDWTLDGVGNMKYVDGYTTGSRLTTSFNEYYSVAGVTNTQDDNGNLTSDGTLTYKCDAFNRLSEVKNGGTTVADYFYDAEGRRVAKVVSGTTTCYSLDGWQEIAEYTGTGASYPDREFIFGSFIDEPLVLDSNDSFDSSCTGTGDNRYYYSQNWQYSVCALTNGSGTVVEGYEYEPYGHHRVFYHSGSAVGFTGGDSISNLGSSHYGNPFMYTGRDFDPETGLQYSRHRYYNPSQTRFVSRDPSGALDDCNLYGYSSGNPTLNLDPLGLWIVTRNPNQPVATACPNASDTWKSLADIVKLDEDEANLWVNGRPKNDASGPQPGKIYLIPNTYYIVMGDVSDMQNGSQKAQINAAKRAESKFRSLGYYTVHAKFEYALLSGHAEGIVYLGHALEIDGMYYKSGNSHFTGILSENGFTSELFWYPTSRVPPPPGDSYTHPFFLSGRIHDASHYRHHHLAYTNLYACGTLTAPWTVTLTSRKGQSHLYPGEVAFPDFNP